MTTIRALAAMVVVCLWSGQAMAEGAKAQAAAKPQGTVKPETAIRHFRAAARGPAAGDKVKVLSFTPRGDGTALVKSMLLPSRVYLIGVVDIRRGTRGERAWKGYDNSWRTMDWWMTSEEAAAKDPSRLTENPYQRR